MEIILSKNIKKLSGTLCKGHGYFIRQTPDNRFVTVRKQGTIPPRGHLNTIFDIAEMTRDGFFVSDIKVHWLELQTALYEAKCFIASEHVRRNYADKCKATYNARDILNLKTTFGL